MILTNKKNNFVKSTTFETGLSDHHKLATTHIVSVCWTLPNEGQ